MAQKTDVEMEAIQPHTEDGEDLRIGDFGSRYGRQQEWWKRREVLLVAGAAASCLFVIVIGLVASSSRDTCSCEEDGKAVGGNPHRTTTLTPLPKPASLCDGGEGGVLRRVSRQAFEYWQSTLPPPDKSLIVMLADGYGPSIHTMARDVRRHLANNATLRLALDDFLVGSAFTGAIGNLITDSAAGATAYSAGRKTFNGALSVEPMTPESDGDCAASYGGSRPVGTSGECAAPGGGREACCAVRRIAHLMEGCKAKGMATGIVVTTLLPHATPAAWSSHSSSRNYYDFIAQQQLQSQPPFDVLLGGGARYFDSRRGDGRDLTREYDGVLVSNRTGLWQEVERSGTGQKPLLGLFADGDMDFQVDRVNERRPTSTQQPSLADMTRAALRRLKATGKPYCLLVEGSRIDHALHSNDAASAALDALAYDDMVREVLEEVRGGDAVEMLSVADHSTGGLTLGMQETFDLDYAGGAGSWKTPPRKWRPEVLAETKMSTGLLASTLCCDPSAFSTADAARDLVSSSVGVTPSSDELSLMIEVILNKMVHTESGIATTTSGHTSEDIHVYAAGNNRRSFGGAMENSQVGAKHLDLLGFSLDFITDALNECQVPVHPV